MKRLRWLITIPLAIILVVLAVNNLKIVEFSLWPLDFIVRWPLFVFIYIGILVGFLFGALVAWLSTAQRHRRRRLRREDKAAQAPATRPHAEPRVAESAGTTSPAIVD